MNLSDAIAFARQAAHAITSRDDPNRMGRSYALTLVNAIRPDRREDLLGILRDFDAVPPMAKFEYVHFARWVIVDQLRSRFTGAPPRPSQLCSPYLLFTADMTFPAYVEDDELPGSFLTDITRRMPSAAHDVWAHCYGYPGPADDEAFVSYLAKSQVSTSLYYAAFADMTPGEISRALAGREAFIGFVREHQGDGAVALREAYEREARKWLH
jgi:hypothetical protein